MRVNYSIDLDQYDESTLKLKQGIALLRMVRSAQGTEAYENLSLSEKTDGLYAIITLLGEAGDLLSGGTVIQGDIK